MTKQTRLQLPYISESTQLVSLFKDQPYSVLLDSCSDLRESSGMDIFACKPKRVFIGGNQHYQILDQDNETCDLGKHWKERLFEFEAQASGVLLGYFSYHCMDATFTKDEKSSEQVDSLFPDICLGDYLWRIETDHRSKQSHLVYNATTLDNKELDSVLTTLESLNPTANETCRIKNKPVAKADTSKAEYLSAFDQIIDFIKSGDCYQVNLAQRFHAKISEDPWQYYLFFRKQSPAPFSAWMKTSHGEILSFSPESFLKINHDGCITSSPIKGTRKRSQIAEHDHDAKTNLLNSTKDKAENLMIVDLIRNDLSKNAIKHSVKVPELFSIKSFSNVHHMISTVTAQKKKNASSLEVLLDCFPGGSITGAPKKRAMEIIKSLETHRREVYCGAIGYVTSEKQMEFNIAIRTILIKDGTLYCWGGGGIVADSEAESEYQESISKISNLISIEESH